MFVSCYSCREYRTFVRNFDAEARQKSSISVPRPDGTIDSLETSGNSRLRGIDEGIIKPRTVESEVARIR